MKDFAPCFTDKEVKLLRDFLEKLRTSSFTSIRTLCKISHVSTRTYEKVLKSQPVKAECYHRLFVGILYSVNYEEFMEEWPLLGQSLYKLYN